jgi:hypothetical protein
MDSASERLGVYRELADTYDRLGQVSMRDRFMILAADAALEAGQQPEAERLRQRLLQASRYHMLRPYNSFAEAIQSPDVQTYLRDLRANYPLDVARQLLATLLPPGTVWTATCSAPVAQHSLPVAIPIDPPPAEPAYPAIPPTAPLIDIYGRQAPAARPTWKPSINAAPAIEPLEMTPAPPAHRPLAQPVPGRPQAARNTTMPQATPARPLAPPAARMLPVAQPAAPQRGSSEQSEPTGGSWLTFLLVGVVVMSGAALTVFTLARPFLPAGWRF